MINCMTGLALFPHTPQESMSALKHFYHEQAGSIAAFLSIYRQQIVQFGYANAPLEMDACAHAQIDF